MLFAVMLEFCSFWSWFMLQPSEPNRTQIPFIHPVWKQLGCWKRHFSVGFVSHIFSFFLSFYLSLWGPSNALKPDILMLEWMRQNWMGDKDMSEYRILLFFLALFCLFANPFSALFLFHILQFHLFYWILLPQARVASDIECKNVWYDCWESLWFTYNGFVVKHEQSTFQPSLYSHLKDLQHAIE